MNKIWPLLFVGLAMVIGIAPPDTPGFSYGEEGGASLLS